jgi:hypothetical protein
MMKNEDSALPPGVTPAVLSEAAAAEFIGESLHVRRLNRRADEKRLERGEPILGPEWFKPGKRQSQASRRAALSIDQGPLTALLDISCQLGTKNPCKAAMRQYLFG